MAENFPVYRLTDDAYHALDLESRDNPDMWLDPDADFHKLLIDKGIHTYKEETGIFSDQPIDLVPVDHGPKNRADKQALDFYNSFTGITPSIATDGRIWEWMTHFELHSYGLWRWRRYRNVNLTNYIGAHWFVKDQGSALWDSNTAARTWWIAHTAIKAANASGGAFSAEEALNHFSNHAEHYHTLMALGAGFTYHPTVVAEFLRALMNEAKGIKRNGVRVIWRRLNLAAGVLLLDALPRENLREYMLDQVKEVMSDPNLVSDRSRVRNRKPTVVLSLGAGVQSTVLALMAERGEYELPRPDFAIFADTGWEPPAVYEHLEWLISQLSFDVVKVQAGNIRESILSGTNPEGRNFLDVPVFLVNTDGSLGVSTRQCTRVYKLDPIRRELRDRLGMEPNRRAPKETQVEMWLGISVDEMARQKPSKDEWITNRYPLIEHGFSRKQLKRWFNENYPGRDLPRSACIGCPYHDDPTWKHLKENDPKSFEDAVSVDRALREDPSTKGMIKGKAYLHRSRIPLAEVDFSDTTDYDTLMEEECEGLCGI